MADPHVGFLGRPERNYDLIFIESVKSGADSSAAIFQSTSYWGKIYLDESEQQLVITTDVVGTDIRFERNIDMYGKDINAVANLEIEDDGELRLWDSGDSHYVGFKAPALTGTKIWTLPIADGNANDVLKTSGAGVLSWVAQASGGAPTGASYLTLGLDGTLSAERVLTAGEGIDFSDTGVNGTLTIYATNGNTAYSWGDHSGAGYLTTCDLWDRAGTEITPNTAGDDLRMDGGGTVGARNTNEIYLEYDIANTRGILSTDVGDIMIAPATDILQVPATLTIDSSNLTIQTTTSGDIILNPIGNNVHLGSDVKIDFSDTTGDKIYFHTSSYKVAISVSTLEFYSARDFKFFEGANLKMFWDGTNDRFIVTGDIRADEGAVVSEWSGNEVYMSYDVANSKGYLDTSAGDLELSSFTGNVLMPAGNYLNYGGTGGDGGYGFWDDSGTIKYKNSSGSWTAITSSYWDRAGTEITPHTAGDDLRMDGGGTVGAKNTNEIYLEYDIANTLGVIATDVGNLSLAPATDILQVPATLTIDSSNLTIQTTTSGDILLDPVSHETIITEEDTSSVGNTSSDSDYLVLRGNYWVDPNSTVLNIYVYNNTTSTGRHTFDVRNTSYAAMFSVQDDGDAFVEKDLDITGDLSKGSGTFRIDHPLDPENKILRHSFVESPEMMLIYKGRNVIGNKGKVDIILPDYFEILNKKVEYSLTSIGNYANLYIINEVENNKFVVGGEIGTKFSWIIYGVRKDKYALKNPIIVEEDKDYPGYIHPDCFVEVTEDIRKIRYSMKKHKDKRKAS